MAHTVRLDSARRLSPGDFEGSEQPDAPKDRETNRGHQLLVDQHKLHDRADHHHKVEPESVQMSSKPSGRLNTNSPPVEKGHHVAGEAKGVHLQQHLAGEETDEEEVGVLLEVVEPERLVVVLGGKNTGVEEDQDHDQPEHPLRLADLPRLPPHLTVPPGMRVSDMVFVLARLSHFSKLFVRFCHAVCRVCLRGFRVSSVTLAVTVTENIRRMFSQRF